MTFYAPRNIGPADQVLFDADGNAVGIQAAGSSSQPVLGFNPTKHAAIDSLVSTPGNPEALVELALNADTALALGTDEVIVSAAGSFLLRAGKCRVVRVRCLSGTADITLRNGITNSVTAADTTSRILWKATGLVAGAEPYVPRGDNGAGILVTEGLHLTLGGTSPVVAIGIR